MKCRSRVADAGRGGADQHLVRPRLVDLDVFDLKRLARLHAGRRPSSHQPASDCTRVAIAIQAGVALIGTASSWLASSSAPPTR